MDNRARLLTAIFSQGFRTPDARHEQPPPVVSIEEFFEGNLQPQSIAPNLTNHPGLAFFRERLLAIRSRSDVQTVLVNVYDLTDIILGVPDGWPGAENVHILTSAPEDVVQEWASDLLSDGAGEGLPYGEPYVAPKGSEAYRWWCLSWD